MKVRTAVFAVTALAGVVSVPILAHEDHDEDETKLMPSACVHLRDAKRYLTDIAYPEVKALKARCDNQKNGADKPAKSTPPKRVEKS